MTSQFSGTPPILNNTISNIIFYLLHMPETLLFKALKLLKFTSADTPWRFKSSFKLHQVPIKSALHQRPMHVGWAGGATPNSLHTASFSSLLSNVLRAQLLIANVHKHIVCLHNLGLIFEMSSVCPLHFPLVFNMSSEFPRDRFFTFLKKAFLALIKLSYLSA